MADQFDEFIEENRVKEEQPAGAEGERQGANEGGTPNTEKKETPAAVVTGTEAAKPEGASAEVKASIPTPKEILGDTDAESWDDIKARVGENKTLREELETSKKQPKVAFANENVAGYNEFVKKTGIEDYSIYRSLSQVKEDDSLAILVADFILKNPQYAGKEEMIGKKIAKDYKITEENTAEEIEINKIQFDTDAKAALKRFQELRESLKVQSEAAAPEDKGLVIKAWKETLPTAVSGMTKLPLPTYNTTSKKYESYLEVDITEADIQEFTEEEAEHYAKGGKASEADVKRIRENFLGRQLLKKLPSIVASIKLKAETDMEAIVDARYNGVDKLKDGEVKPGGEGVEDPYDKLNL